MQLHEKYRPTTLADMAGNDKQLAFVQKLFKSPTWDRDAFWIQGTSGSGKTTLANIIAQHCCDERDIIELPGSECTAEAVHDIAYQTCLATWGGRWKAFIINEANAMSSKSVQVWKTVLEPLKARRLYIFTSARPIDTLFETGAENQQLASRCKVLTLHYDEAAYARKLHAIAQNEGINIAYGECQKLLKKAEGNMRAALQALETYELNQPAAPVAVDDPAELLRQCEALLQGATA